jgi:signal transduction histidine kinase
MNNEDLMALVAHELRGPIAAISTAAQVLRLCDPAGRDAVEARDLVERQAQKMAATLDRFTQLARLLSQGPTRRERVELVAMLREHTGLRGGTDVDAAWIETDGGLLAEALSLFALEAPSAVTVRLTRAPEGAELILEPVGAGAGVHLVHALLEIAHARVRRLVAGLPC